MARVRFAPSPTGRLHLGGARTALFNYLYARTTGGRCILRIEDTDKERFVPGAARSLQESFDWLGLHFDEGPSIGGRHGPYVQSERFAVYQRHARDLLSYGHAYYCFCSRERLRSLTQGYDGHCRKLSARQVQERLQMGVAHTVRLKVPDSGSTVICDQVYGQVEVLHSAMDDQVVLKSDGSPTYHLAAVVDDHLMEISHVLRGEEWLLSTAKHLLLFSALQWTPPTYAHLPLLLSSPGRKLSKRNDDVFVDNYKERGFQPESIINFIALLGWGPSSPSPDSPQKIFTLNELCADFSLNDIPRRPAIVNEAKLKWMNRQHFKKKLTDESCLDQLARELQDVVGDVFDIAGDDERCEVARMKKILLALEDRIPFVRDVGKEASYFWEAPAICTDLFPAVGTDECAKLLMAVYDSLEKCDIDNQGSVSLALTEVASGQNVPYKQVMALVRIAVTGVKGGPILAAIMHILGKDEVLRRLRHSIKLLNGTTNNTCA